MMKIQLNKELAQKIKELAQSLGLNEDEIVQKILEWYFEDSEK